MCRLTSFGLIDTTLIAPQPSSKIPVILKSMLLVAVFSKKFLGHYDWLRLLSMLAVIFAFDEVDQQHHPQKPR